MKKIILVSLLMLPGCDTISGPADIQSMRESRPLGSTKELNLDLNYAVGQLEIERLSNDKLFAFDLQYDRRRYDASFKFDEGDRASLRVNLDSHGGFGSGGGHDNELTLRLTDKVPIELNLSAGVSESRLEMSGLKIRRMHLRGGVGKTEMTFDKPSGQVMESFEVESGVGELIIHGLGNTQVRRLEVKGGVGHTEVDFSGDLGTSPIDARVKVGVGEVRLKIPRDADVEIEAEGSFLSNISAPSFEKNGRNYTHRGSGGPKLHIQVESGVGGVEVELI